MPAVSATAPRKIILLGEHAVVYDRAAIAIPFNGVHAKVIVFATPIAPTSQVRIEAQAIGLDQTLDQLETDHPFTIAIHGVMAALGIGCLPVIYASVPPSPWLPGWVPAQQYRSLSPGQWQPSSVTRWKMR